MHRIILTLAAAAATFMLTMPFAAVASATAKTDICTGVAAVTGDKGCDSPKDSPSVDSTLALVVNVLSVLVGVIAVVMVIIGGLKYIMSQGDSTQLNSAKNTILYAIIGLVIVVLAQIIVHFVIYRVSKAV